MSQVWVEVSHQNLATFAPLFQNALCHHGAKVHHKRKHYSWDGQGNTIFQSFTAWILHSRSFLLGLLVLLKTRIYLIS
jgi:hypothetical protein